MNDIKVVGLGALNMDYLYRVERILTDGEATVKDSTRAPGGSAANTIYGLARLGVKTGFVGVVGSDADGKALVKDFRSARVDTSHIGVKSGDRSGAVLGLTDSLGRRSLYVSPGANSLLTMSDLDLGYFNQAQVLHITSFADEAQFRMSVELVDRLAPSVKLSFSPGALYAAKKLKALKSLISRSHLLFLNYHEIRQLTAKGMVAGAETCLKLGCSMVVVTLGRGRRLELRDGIVDNAICYIRDARREYAVSASASPIPKIEATGAGDAFAAGFLYGFLTGKKPVICGQLGDVVARFVIGKVGTRAGFPRLKELKRSYQELYQGGVCINE